jgi:hypothetical protein
VGFSQNTGNYKTQKCFAPIYNRSGDMWGSLEPYLATCVLRIKTVFNSCNDCPAKRYGKKLGLRSLVILGKIFKTEITYLGRMFPELSSGWQFTKLF